MVPFWSSRRRSLLIVLAALCLTPLVAWGAVVAVRSNANDVADWLPGHYRETAQYRWFQQQFGSEDFVVVSWPGCTLDDERLDKFADSLGEQDRQRTAAGQPKLWRRVTTGRALVRQLAAPPIGLGQRTTIARLRGTLVGPDSRQTCAVVTLSDAARGQLHAALAEIRSTAAKVGIPPAQIELGGPPVVNAAIDRSSSQSLVRLAGLAAAIGLLVAWLCFRTVRLTVVVFVIATYSAALSLAIVPLCGVPLNAILVTMVPLVYVAAMSGAIHLSNYYLDALRGGRSEGAIGRAVKHAALPLGLATGTTAIGLLSLLYSDLLPIRLFGLFSAIGVVVSLTMQLVLLPALLELWPAADRSSSGDAPADDEDLPEPLSGRWRGLADFVIARQASVALACLVVLVFSAVGLVRVETSIQIMRLFAPSTPIIADYNWLEEHLGALVPMEVVLRFDAANTENMVERLDRVRAVQASLAELPAVGGSLSAATFAPEFPVGQGGSLRSFMVNRRLALARPRLVESGYLVRTADEELWRISVRVGEVDDLDYGLFQEQLRQRIEPLVAPGDKPGHDGISVVYTGAVPIIYKARRSLLDGLALGFGTDVLLIVIAVVIALRHWTGGLLLLLTSIFPMTLVFGAMGWSGTVVDIGSVMTPCVALGVTIDDVIHFVLWFRRGAAGGLSVPDSVRLAYAGCGRAMVQSWGVIGLGLAAFALSSFTPTFRFGALMIALLSVGLVGNLLFLPALLAGPLGRSMARGLRAKPAPPIDSPHSPPPP